jgi:hypothetical protein
MHDEIRVQRPKRGGKITVSEIEPRGPDARWGMIRRWVATSRNDLDSGLPGESSTDPGPEMSEAAQHDHPHSGMIAVRPDPVVRAGVWRDTSTKSFPPFA